MAPVLAYQFTSGEMSALTGAITIQNTYHNMEVTMATPNSHPIPCREDAPGDAIDLDRIYTDFPVEDMVLRLFASSAGVELSRNVQFITLGPYHPSAIPTRPSPIL